MVTGIAETIKSWWRRYRVDLYLGTAVFLVAVGSFGLGRLSAVWKPKPPLSIKTPGAERAATPASPDTTPMANAASVSTPPGAVVASKNGTSYHAPECPGAKQIKSENLITFQSAAAASAAGYKPAGNCPALGE